MSPSPNALHHVAVQLFAERLPSAARRTDGIAFVTPFDVVLFEHTVVQPEVPVDRGTRRSERQ